MQVPGTIGGLRHALGALGYGSLLDGFDVEQPNIRKLLVKQLDADFEGSDRTAGDAYRRASAVTLITLFPWDASCSAKTKYAVDAALDAIETADDLIQEIPMPPVKDGPPAKVMNIKEVDEPAQEVTLEPGKLLDDKVVAKVVRFELADLAKRGQIPKFRYSVKVSAGQPVDITTASGRDPVESMLNLPVVLAEKLQGYGYLPNSAKFKQVRPALKELQNLLEKKLIASELRAQVTVASQARRAVEDKLLGDYVRVMGSDRPLFSGPDFRKDPEGCVAAYKDILQQAGYSDRELSASALNLIMAKPSEGEHGDLIKKYARMFYSATMGAPAEIQSGSKEAYLQHLKDMQAKYPTADLESHDFVLALQNEAERWWNSRKVKGSGTDW